MIDDELFQNLAQCLGIRWRPPTLGAFELEAQFAAGPAGPGSRLVVIGAGKTRLAAIQSALRGYLEHVGKHEPVGHD